MIHVTACYSSKFANTVQSDPTPHAVPLHREAQFEVHKETVWERVRELMDTARYMASFDSRIVALTGTPDEIADVARKYRAIYKRVPTKDGYTMDHTATVYLMNREGKLASSLSYQEDQKTQLAKLRRLIAGPP